MRVLYINQTAAVAGAEMSLLTLIGGVPADVEQIACCPEGELAVALRERGIDPTPIRGTEASFRPHPIHTPRALFDIGASALQVRRIVARTKPDLVYANNTRSALLALIGRRRGGPPVLAHIRDHAPAGRASRAVFGLIGARADAVVATSNYVAEQFRGLRLPRPVSVINDPIDLAEFAAGGADGPAARAALDLSPGTVVLSLVGMITPLKGQDTAIEATADLIDAGLDVDLLLVGSVKFGGAGTRLDNVGFDRRLHELVAARGVGERVHFLGERPDVPALLAATDVLLMPFWADAFGRVSPEAMSLGVPIVASEVGGPAETVRDGLDGILLPPREAPRWSEALAALVRDPAERARMGSNARERAGDFDVVTHVAKMTALWQVLTESSPRTGAIYSAADA